MSFRLAYIEGDLVFKILPLIGHCIIHMYRIPDNISQKANRILMKGRRLMKDYTALFFFIIPVGWRYRLTCGTIHHLPPSADIISGIHLHQFIRDSLHERNFQRIPHRRIKAGHDITLLNLIRVSLCPHIILSGGIIGRINFCSCAGQFFGELRTVTIPDGICPPAFHYLDCFGNNVQIGWNSHSSCLLLFHHKDT